MLYKGLEYSKKSALDIFSGSLWGLPFLPKLLNLGIYAPHGLRL